MERQSVQSSDLVSVGYDNLTKKLEIEFSDHRVYQYANVPLSVYQGLMRASSLGQYHHKHIKHSYQYHRVPYQPSNKKAFSMQDLGDFYCIRTAKGIFYYKPSEHDIRITATNSGSFRLEIYGGADKSRVIFSSSEEAKCKEVLVKIGDHMSPMGGNLIKIDE